MNAKEIVKLAEECFNKMYGNKLDDVAQEIYNNMDSIKDRASRDLYLLTVMKMVNEEIISTINYYYNLRG
jgi:hypothetical protein